MMLFVQCKLLQKLSKFVVVVVNVFWLSIPETSDCLKNAGFFVYWKLLKTSKRFQLFGKIDGFGKLV